MILWCLTGQHCVDRRRRQVRAAGTTNRLVGQDPRSQPCVSSRQSRTDRGLHSGTPVGSATPCHLASASTPKAKDFLPCPCTATIGEEAGNAPSGVPSACSASCTSFEKSSLLSSRVPPPTHDMASLSVGLGSLRPSYSTTNRGSKRNSRCLSRHC